MTLSHKARMVVAIKKGLMLATRMPDSVVDSATNFCKFVTRMSQSWNCSFGRKNFNIANLLSMKKGEAIIDY